MNNVGPHGTKRNNDHYCFREKKRKFRDGAPSDRRQLVHVRLVGVFPLGVVGALTVAGRQRDSSLDTLLNRTVSREIMKRGCQNGFFPMLTS